MLGILADRTYRHLFAAQIVALMGTGLATVALGLLAYDLAGGNAALILGTVFTLKMVAYVALAPLAGALAAHLPRRRLLVALDLVRAGVALSLPFVDTVGQVYLLICLLYAASAAFTPAFQATIPDVLLDEARYTRALSLSRLAYDLESILSPALAAMALVFLSHDALFVGTAAGFAASALLVASVVIPQPTPSGRRGFRDRLTRGLRIYLATPRLRGLIALNVAVSAGGAMVLVNTVVLVRGALGLGDSAVAIAMGAFGLGSMLAALVLPRLLDHLPDRPVMSAGAALMATALIGLAVCHRVFGPSWPALLAAWLLVGLGYSAVLTPSGRLLRRSSRPEDRPAVFAAQFALSHAAWLVCYPVAGVLMTAGGGEVALVLLALVAFAGLMLARRLWPARDPQNLAHRHDDLPEDHPHLRGGRHHAHPFVIDDLHPNWPAPHPV